MAGRVEVYVHGDNSTPNKGAAMIKIQCTTDFTARTSEFIEFSKAVAKYAYATQAMSWDQIAVQFPEMERSRLELSSIFREMLEITEVAVMVV